MNIKNCKAERMAITKLFKTCGPTHFNELIKILEKVNFFVHSSFIIVYIL